MNIKKYFLFSCVALMSVACQDDKPENPKSTPKPGQDIVISGFLEKDATSRTVYGDEDKATHSFPIAWIKDDPIFVYSPDLASMNQSLYTVVESAEQAGDFQKVGETGVQWGKESNARFYSVYPGIYAGDKSVTVDYNESSKETTFNLNMTNVQTCKYNPNTFRLDSVDRFGAIMYAKTPQKVDNGADVNLQYKALSTGIRVRLLGPKDPGEIASITQIRLIAPEPIAGDFTATFTDTDNTNMPVVKPVEGNTSNEIILFTQYDEGTSFLNLPYGKSVDLNFFLIPRTDKVVSLEEGWRIEVILAGSSKLTKKLDRDMLVEGNANLTPGKIHRLKDLPNISLDGAWDISKWMTYIPRNVYLSEISIPGSWESMNKNFQGTNPSLETQYNNGCRAFHINCCYQQNTGILGIDDGGPSTEKYTDPKDVYMTASNNPTFASALRTIAKCVKDDEYMIVLCTLRLKAGIPDHHNWMEDIATACNDVKVEGVDRIFNGNDLTPNTTVGEVLGKVIVIVNCEGDPTKLVPAGTSKCVFVNAPLILKVADFPKAGKYNPGFVYNEEGTSTGISFLNTQGQVTSSNDMTPYVTAFRGFAPRLTEDYSGWITDWSGSGQSGTYDTGSRKTNASVLLKKSHDYFVGSGYAHDTWYYFGLGGYIKERLVQTPPQSCYTQVANTLNTWINNQVKGMATDNVFYPVGIVLMNFASVDSYGGTTVNGKTTAVNILTLNNRYHKAYDPKKPAFPPVLIEDETPSTPSSRAAADGWD